MDLIIDALRNYDSNPEYYKLMHKSQVYEWKKNYITDYRKHQDKHILLWLPKDSKSDGMGLECPLVCRPEEIFDAIESSHREVGHKKIAPTYKQVQQYYYNITRSMVAEFINLCPVCSVKPSKTKKKQVVQSIL